MEEVLDAYCSEYGLSPFHDTKSPSRTSTGLYKTSDGRATHTKVINTLSKQFVFSDTSALWGCFQLTQSQSELERRQAFFGSLHVGVRDFLPELSLGKVSWRPPYGVVVVTEDEKIFTQLKELGCPVKYLITEYDVQSLEVYDVVQVIGCDQYYQTLERLPQTVFLESIEEVYLERHVELLSRWTTILEQLAPFALGGKVGSVVGQLVPLLVLTKQNVQETVSLASFEDGIERINTTISTRMRDLVLTGDALLALVQKEKLPPQLQTLVREAIASSGLPGQICSDTIPVRLNEPEADRLLKKYQATQFISIAEAIRKQSTLVMQIPALLASLERALIVYDFCTGVVFYTSSTTGFPTIGPQCKLIDAKNIFLSAPQPITFLLDAGTRASLLTGANSGGKTTLLEHVTQLVSLHQLGLPVKGIVELPLFTEVYYFAKNKGSMNKGAFETLLTQLASISPGTQTLILADEIEAVTEPGVAGLLICATVQYFVEKGCFMVIATHLGQEIQHTIPAGSRIDGIEAKGLDANFDLIIDHAPVLGRLANSTPELIIERMAKTQSAPYFAFVHQYLLTKKET
ncbi:hypothetical protein EXS73_02490 [Candidatus Pacearchaeota archaeon]|nr:hypothetical protein [Candidatus Pacearchaeota archaeon]